MGDRLREPLCVRVRGEASWGDIVVGGKCLESGEDVDKVLLKPFEKVETSENNSIFTLSQRPACLGLQQTTSALSSKSE